jgi:hypothetical protein
LKTSDEGSNRSLSAIVKSNLFVSLGLTFKTRSLVQHFRFIPIYPNARCNGLQNRCSASEHAFFVRPLGIAPEDRAPAQIISAFVGLLAPVLAKDSKRLLPGFRYSGVTAGNVIESPDKKRTIHHYARAGGMTRRMPFRCG